MAKDPDNGEALIKEDFEILKKAYPGKLSLINDVDKSLFR